MPSETSTGRFPGEAGRPETQKPPPEQGFRRRGLKLRVPDVEAARERLSRRGVEFFGKTLDTGVCLMGFFYDPDGNVLILHRRYAPR